jgi:hypothetical protein
MGVESVAERLDGIPEWDVAMVVLRWMWQFQIAEFWPIGVGLDLPA